jgi:hypothetical protein
MVRREATYCGLQYNLPDPVSRAGNVHGSISTILWPFLSRMEYDISFFATQGCLVVRVNVFHQPPPKTTPPRYLLTVKCLIKSWTDIDEMNKTSASKGYAGLNGPSPLCQAAARLARAATKLSAAAQEIYLAAEELYAANSLSQMGVIEPTEPANDDQGLESPIPVEKSLPDEKSVLDEKIIQNGASEDECTNPENSEYYISGGTYLMIPDINTLI